MALVQPTWKDLLSMCMCLNLLNVEGLKIGPLTPFNAARFPINKYLCHPAFWPKNSPKRSPKNAPTTRQGPLSCHHPEVLHSTWIAPNLLPRVRSVERGSFSENGGVVCSGLSVAKATTILQVECVRQSMWCLKSSDMLYLDGYRFSFGRARKRRNLFLW